MSARTPRIGSAGGLAGGLAAAVAVTLTAMHPAAAAEVTLPAVSAFAEKTMFSREFEAFIDRVNKSGKGLVRIDYKGGGGKVMNPFQLGDAIRSGVVKIGNLPGAFYTKQVPEVDALKLANSPIAVQRKNGAWDFMNKLHMEKMNAYNLARQFDCIPFHIYLNKPIKAADLKGLKIRVTPIYRAFFAEMGATMIQTAPGDVYTAMERGTVDGYGWPSQGIFDLGWHEVTKYRVDPGFYRASVEILINLDAWKGLDDKQKKVLSDAAMVTEGNCAADQQRSAAELARQAKQGIKAITFEGAEGKAFLERAQTSGWAEVIKANPQNGPKLKQLLSQ